MFLPVVFGQSFPNPQKGQSPGLVEPGLAVPNALSHGHESLCRLALLFGIEIKIIKLSCLNIWSRVLDGFIGKLGVRIGEAPTCFLWLPFEKNPNQ